MNTDNADRLRMAMLKAGDLDFGGRLLKDAAPELLKPTDDTVQDHWEIHPGAIAYYGALLNEAKQELEDTEELLRCVMVQHSKTLRDVAKTKYGLTRPSKDELVSVAKLEGNDDVTTLAEQVKTLSHSVETLQVWLKAWESKSFTLNALTKTSVAVKQSLNVPRTPIRG